MVQYLPFSLFIQQQLMIPLICLIVDERLVILAMSVGHRQDVYEKY